MSAEAAKVQAPGLGNRLDTELWALKILVVTLLAKSFEQAPDINALAGEYEQLANGMLYEVAAVSRSAHPGADERAARMEAAISKIISSAARAAAMQRPS